MPWSAVLLGLLALYIGITNVLNARESNSWPTVKGVISKSEVSAHSGSGGDQSVSSSVTYHADIEYDYVVGEERFKGDRIAFGDFGTADRADAETIIGKYPKGIEVNVFYKPKDPQLSLLETGVRTSTWVPVFFGIPFILVGIVLLTVLPKNLNK